MSTISMPTPNSFSSNNVTDKNAKEVYKVKYIASISSFPNQSAVTGDSISG